MDVWLTFAYISEHEVKNIACFLYTGFTEANDFARDYCNDSDAFAVDVTHIPVQIGDTYEDGNFYRNGNIIEPLPTVEQQTNANTADIESHDSAIDDLWVALLEG